MVWKTARPDRKLLLLPRLDAVQGSSPGMSSAEGRGDPEPASGIVTDLAQDSGTDSSSLGKGLLGSRGNNTVKHGRGPVRGRNSGET